MPTTRLVLEEGVRQRSIDAPHERVVHQATVCLGPQHAVDLPLLFLWHHRRIQLGSSVAAGGKGVIVSSTEKKTRGAEHFVVIEKP